jgi:hypothetical protein
VLRKEKEIPLEHRQRVLGKWDWPGVDECPPDLVRMAMGKAATMDSCPEAVGNSDSSPNFSANLTEVSEGE